MHGNWLDLLPTTVTGLAIFLENSVEREPFKQNSRQRLVRKEKYFQNRLFATLFYGVQQLYRLG